jgi:hypothetical protein
MGPRITEAELREAVREPVTVHTAARLVEEVRRLRGLILRAFPPVHSVVGADVRAGALALQAEAEAMRAETEGSE